MGQLAIACAKALLGFPGDGLDRVRGPLGAPLHGGALAGREAVTPGGFDQHPPHVAVARFGDAAAAFVAFGFG